MAKEEAATAQEKMTVVKGRKIIAKEKVASAEVALQDVATQVLADFRELQDFAKEVTKGSTKAYQLGFFNCKAKVALVFPNIDLIKMLRMRLKKRLQPL